VVVAGAETGKVLLCFKRCKDLRNQVALAVLLLFQSSEMQRRQ